MKIYYSLAIAASSLLIYSGTTSGFERATFGPLGVLSEISPSFWLGFCIVSILVAAIIVDRSTFSAGFYSGVLILLATFLFSVGPTWNLFVQYYPVSEVKIILDTGHLAPVRSLPAITYMAWPAIHFITASLVYLAGGPLVGIVDLVPIWLGIMVCPLFLLIGKRINLGVHNRFRFSVIGVTSLWAPWFGYNPPSIALVLYILLFALLLAGGRDTKGKAILLLVFSSIILSHGLTSAAVVSVMAVSLILWRMGTTRMSAVLILLAFVAWYAFNLDPLFSAGVTLFFQGLSSFDVAPLVGSNLYGGARLSVNLLVVYGVYLSFFSVYLALLVFSLVAMVRGRIIGMERNRIALMSLVWILGLAPLSFITYGFELAIRLYLFAFVPILVVYFVACNPPRKLVLLIFLVTILLSMPARYDGDAAGVGVLQTSSAELVGARFFASYTNPCSSYFYTGWSNVLYWNPSLVSTLKVIENPLLTNITSLVGANYIIESDVTHAYLLFHTGKDVIQQNIVRNASAVPGQAYSNGEFSVYLMQRGLIAKCH